MKKKNYLYMFLGLFLALTIVPGVSMWLGFSTPSQGIARMFTAVLGESSLVNDIIAFSVLGVFIALVILGASKVMKKMEKTT
ncbi:hypothetical protein [Psychrobacillus sp. L3]|uniref:hypothetical protein n=1 Tax=Psychrobacillus sp. L3 TaxID=3236891 RepID=UPI0036F2642A